MAGSIGNEEAAVVVPEVFGRLPQLVPFNSLLFHNYLVAVANCF